MIKLHFLGILLLNCLFKINRSIRQKKLLKIILYFGLGQNIIFVNLKSQCQCLSSHEPHCTSLQKLIYRHLSFLWPTTFVHIKTPLLLDPVNVELCIIKRPRTQGVIKLVSFTSSIQYIYNILLGY